MAFYNGGAYPTAYNGTLFFGDYSRNCIWAMATGTNGLPDPAKITTFGAGAPTPVDLEIGPNGDLFYVDIGGGTVREIRYLGGNRPPVATATADVTNGTAPLTVSFDGSTSSDPDPGDTITYSWDLNGDGVYGSDSTVARPTYTYQTPGTYNARLKVTDSHAASTVSSQITITAEQTRRRCRLIQTPLSTFIWKVGDTIFYSGSASDAQDGALPASSLAWTVLLQHCPSNCHTARAADDPGRLEREHQRTGPGVSVVPDAAAHGDRLVRDQHDDKRRPTAADGRPQLRRVAPRPQARGRADGVHDAVQPNGDRRVADS